MKQFTGTIDVNVPVRQAYNQWTQFEDFPRFMDAVEKVTQLSDTMMHWEAEIAGVDQEWDAEITEQTPDHRIAWKNTTGAHHAGVVSFHRLNDDQTRVTLQIDYDPEGFIENVGAALGFVNSQLQSDLENFKEFIENRDEATGAWRESVVTDKA